MFGAILCDFSWTLLHPKDRSYAGSINGLNKQLGGGDPFGPYNFADYFVLNTQLLDFLLSLKMKHHITLFLFTTDIIQERPEVRLPLARVFDRVISGHDIVTAGLVKTEDLNKTKTDPVAYSFIAKEMKCNPPDILFIDDTQANLDAARIAEFETMLYKKMNTIEMSNRDCFERIESLFRLH